MKNRILRIFLFALINILLLLGHFWLFNKQPVFGYITATLHIVVLIIFPYSKLAKNKP